MPQDILHCTKKKIIRWASFTGSLITKIQDRSLMTSDNCRVRHLAVTIILQHSHALGKGRIMCIIIIITQQTFWACLEFSSWSMHHQETQILFKKTNKPLSNTFY